MCSNDNTPTATLVPYTLKSMSTEQNACTAAAAAAAAAYMSINPNLTQAALDHYRLQLYNYASYADRFRYTHPAIASHFAMAANGAPYGHHHQGGAHHHPQLHQQHHHHHAEGMFAAALSPYAKFDPRFRLHQEEPKPQHSYIGLIGMAILSAPDKKLVLSDIYQYILDNYAYFRSRGPGWRNSIRHNLSLNDCFIKSGRSANGKGHYWAIHPANLEDFKKGDFRRRKAQRRVRKHMGLAVPDDEDSVSPPPPLHGATSPTSRPLTPSSASVGGANGPLGTNPLNGHNHLWSQPPNRAAKPDSTTTGAVLARHHVLHAGSGNGGLPPMPLTSTLLPILAGRRRQFDMESLLAPDRPSSAMMQHGAAAAMLRTVEAHHHHQRNMAASMHAGNVPVTTSAATTRYVDTVYPRRQSLINGGRLMMVQVPDHHHPHQQLIGHPRPIMAFDSQSAIKDGGCWKMGNTAATSTDRDGTGRRLSAILSPVPSQCGAGGQNSDPLDKVDQDGGDLSVASIRPSSNSTDSKRCFSTSYSNNNSNKRLKSYKMEADSDEAEGTKTPHHHDNDGDDTDMLDDNPCWNDEEDDGTDADEKNSCCSDVRTTPSPPFEMESIGGLARHSPSTASARGQGSPGLSRDSSVGTSPSPNADKEFVEGGHQNKSPRSSPFGGGAYSSITPTRSGPAARALVCVAAAAKAAAQNSSPPPPSSSSLSPSARSATTGRSPHGHPCHVTTCSPGLESPWHNAFLHHNGTPTSMASPATPSQHHYRLGPLQQQQQLRHQHHHQPYVAINGVQCSSVVGSGAGTVTSSPVGLTSPQGLPIGSSFSNDIQLSTSISSNANNGGGSSLANVSSHNQQTITF